MSDLPDAPPPVEAALERIGRLTAAGATPDAVTRAVGEIVAGWADEAGVDAGTAQSRVGEMWDSLTRDEADLEAAINDAGEGDPAALATAGRMQTALQAAIQALAAVAERFG